MNFGGIVQAFEGNPPAAEYIKSQQVGIMVQAMGLLCCNDEVSMVVVAAKNRYLLSWLAMVAPRQPARRRGA